MQRVVIGAGSGSYAAALADVLREEPGLLHVGSVRDAGALVALVTAIRPETAIVDVRLPGGGIEAVADGLARSGATCRLVAVAALPAPSARASAHVAGAVALVAKSNGADIIAAVTRRGG